MPLVIQLKEVLTLSGLHLLYIAIMIALGWFLLQQRYRPLLIGLCLIGWVWSAGALYDFYLQDPDFLSWFLNSAAEKNFMAIATSLLLSAVGITALMLVWRSHQKQPLWQRAYWLLLAVMFLFLALDEYTSIHEQFDWWRQFYLALGGTVGLLSLIMLVFGDKALRPYRLFFIIGLGSLGFAGVILDAFSNENIIDIGPYNLTMFACHRAFLGVRCLFYGNTEELWEFVGASVMWLSLMSVAYLWQPEKQALTRRILAATVGLWAFVIIGWIWLFPMIENPFARPLQVQYDDVTITGYSVSQETIKAGDTLDVTLYLEANHNLIEDYSLSVHLYTQPAANSIAQDDMLLGENEYPTRAWIAGLPVRNRFSLAIPQDLQTGVSYQLVAMLWKDDAMQSIPANETSQPTLLNGNIIILQSMPALAESVPPAPDNGGYRFAEGFILAGYEMPSEAQAGDMITLRFWWKSDTAVGTPLTHFIHATHIETDELIVFDQIPFAGQFPTPDWPAGMRAVDEWSIQLPSDMPPGRYRIQTGLYHSFRIERMAITDASGQAVHDAAIVLGELEISAADD
jgi:hypothetical protein